MPYSGDMDERDHILVSRAELARRWRVSVETLKTPERLRILRPIRLDGRVVRYRWSDILRVENESMDHWEGTAR
jgi:hypothetical protein